MNFNDFTTIPTQCILYRNIIFRKVLFHKIVIQSISLYNTNNINNNYILFLDKMHYNISIINVYYFNFLDINIL